MDCDKKKFGLLHLMPLALLCLSVFGFYLLSCSHSIYVQEEIAYSSCPTENHFEESVFVKSIDIIGLLFIFLPLAGWLGILFAKIWKSIRGKNRFLCNFYKEESSPSHSARQL